MRRLAVLLLALVLLSPTPAIAADNPRATLSPPSEGVSVPLNEPLLVIGDAYNGEAGGVIQVDVTTDDGATWTSIDTQSYWSLVITPTTPGPLTIKARAHTASTVGPVQSLRTIHVSGTTLPPLSGETFLMLPRTQQPVVKDIDDQAVELGLRITVDRPGSLVGVHLRHGNYTGPVTARVWSSNGTLLAEQAVPGAVYGQRVTFNTPVPVAPGNEYVVSYYTPSGGYVSTENYFTGNLVQTPFRTPVNAGVYRYGGGFPTDTWNSSNYWLMPIFQP
ncbi:molybdenum-dependent oxidoreductase-like protein [Lentzea atacamensis]|uniref:Molybdenum-dependent oxidoreductase-like protein n=1 Tax=Lentzea atacamensis TaxID=531938 RepID=A0A316HR57_9PSEU|nr:molybdenum-dependent oxidoreductase-like protein [Lentzea atacamensis]